MRKLPSPEYARQFAGACWALRKNPGDLTERQSETLKRIKRSGGAQYRAYWMKESLLAIFAGYLTGNEVSELIGRWCSRASRSRIQSLPDCQKRSVATKMESWLRLSLEFPKDTSRG